VLGVASVRGRVVFDALQGRLSKAPISYRVFGKLIDSIYAEPLAGRTLRDDGTPAVPPGVVF